MSVLTAVEAWWVWRMYDDQRTSLLRRVSDIFDSMIYRHGTLAPASDGSSRLTPGMLDRLAAAVGATTLYPGRDLLIVDMGTAITIDLVEGGVYRGGNISPGMNMRFRALHDYTARLPLESATDEIMTLGNTTSTAVGQGVMQGIVNEIEGYIESFSKKNREISTIFTGGDAKRFVKRIKNAIFADCELVVCGLNRILDYNANKE